MPGPMISNVDQMQPSHDDLLSNAETALRSRVPIGTLFGETVYLNMLDRMLIFGDKAVSVDHPLYAGTAIRDAALRAMGEF
jgi:hypothetical protein